MTRMRNPYKLSNDIYAEKCKAYWTEFQQQQIFDAANREITKIRDQMEKVLRGSNSGSIQLDTKDAAEQDSRNRLMVQRSIFEILKRFNGMPEGEYG